MARSSASLVIALVLLFAVGSTFKVTPLLCQAPSPPINGYSFCAVFTDYLICTGLCPAYFLHQRNNHTSLLDLTCELSTGKWSPNDSFPDCAPKSNNTKPCSRCRTKKTSLRTSRRVTKITGSVSRTSTAHRSTLKQSKTSLNSSTLRSKSTKVRSTRLTSPSTFPPESSTQHRTRIISKSTTGFETSEQTTVLSQSTEFSLGSSSFRSVVSSSTPALRTQSAVAGSSSSTTYSVAMSSETSSLSSSFNSTSKLETTSSLRSTESSPSSESSKPSVPPKSTSTSTINNFTSPSATQTCFQTSLFTATQVGSTQTTTVSSAFVTTTSPTGTTAKTMPSTTSSCYCYCH